MSNQPEKFCFILRGLPGTGKDLILGAMVSNNLSIPIINTDNYFIKDEKYHFDKTKLKDAHKESFHQFKEAIERDERLIIINNTNIKKFHYSHYLDYAQRHGYLVAIIILPANDVSDEELAKRNIHGVSRWDIRKMRKAFEWEI